MKLRLNKSIIYTISAIMRTSVSIKKIFFFTAVISLFFLAPPASNAKTASAPGEMSPDEEQAATLYYNGQHERALVCIERGLAERPGSLPLVMLKGHILRQLGEAPEAARVYQEALRISPQDPAVAYYLALCYYLTAKHEKALSVIAHLQKNPERPPYIGREAAFLKGVIELENGRFADAKATFSESCELFRKNSRFLQMLGRSSELCGDSAAAHSAYIDAFAGDPSALEFLAQAAPFIRKTGDTANAFKFYYHLQRIGRDENIKKAFRQIEAQYAKIRSAQDAGRKTLEPQKAAYPEKSFKKGEEISVGLSSRSDGSPVEIKSVRLKSSGRFGIFTSAGKKVFDGAPGTLYELSISSGVFSVKNAETGKTSRIGSGSVTIKNSAPGDTVLFRGIKVGSGSSWENSEARYYRGVFDVRQFPGGRHFHVVNRLGIEEYLLSVVPSEMPASYHPSALAAQAVCCRSEAIHKKRHLKKHEKYGFDVCDDQHCQMYRGVSWEDAISSSAVGKTSGLVLVSGGKVCDAIYSDNCGGFTQASADISGWGNFPYLASAPDVAGAAAKLSAMVSPTFMEEFFLDDSKASCREGGQIKGYESRWVRMIQASDVDRALAPMGLGKILRIVPRRRAFSGHLDSLEIVGTRGRKVIKKELEIRKIFPYSPLRSSKFVVETVSNANGEPRAFWFYGAGFGHGVGMCQNGADGRARGGDDFREILAHYFSGARLQKL